MPEPRQAHLAQSHHRCSRSPKYLPQQSVRTWPGAAAGRRSFSRALMPRVLRAGHSSRFVVPRQVEAAFLAAWRQREQDMQHFGGFQGFNIIHDGEVYTVSSSWASIPEWEAWSLSPQCRRSHLPLGIWQFVPKKGEGFPEDFVFIQNYDDPVIAKY